MSILGALKVQKANQQSIADLAALPQNQIIRLAQMGQIPADVVPVVISEKARMAQEAANLRAAQQVGGGEMPTVIEQAMRANAQQETPRAAETGLAGIPLGPMFQEKNFKSGGIVAFQGGGVPSADPTKNLGSGVYSGADFRELPLLAEEFPVPESQDSILQSYRHANELLDDPAKFNEFAGQMKKQLNISDFEIANRLAKKRKELGAQIDTSRPSSEARPATQADTNSYVYDPNDPSAGYKPGPGSIDMDSYEYLRGVTERDAIYAPEIAASRAEMAERYRQQQEQQAARAAERAAEVEKIRKEYGDEAAEFYQKHGYLAPGAFVQQSAPAAVAPEAARSLVPPAAGLAAAAASPTAPAEPVAPVVRPAAQQSAGLATALTGRTSTAEGDEGVAEAQRAEAARRAAAAGQTPTVAPKGFEEVLANIRRAYGGPETAGITPERKAYLDMLKAGSMSQRDIEKQQGMRLLQAGLGILGGQSPYALRNIAEGSKEALQGYAEDIRGQRAQKLAEAKSAAEIAELRRAEQRQEVNTALDVYGKQLDREQRAKLAAERTAVADRFARNYAAKMQKAGDKRSIEELLDEGYVRYLEEAGQAQERIRQTAQTAAAGQGVQLAGQQVTSQGQAQDARATALNAFLRLPRDNPMAKEYRRLARIDKDNAEKGNPTSLAEAYKNQKINEMAQGIVDGQAAAPAQPRPGAGASAAPPAPLGTAANPIRIQ